MAAAPRGAEGGGEAALRGGAAAAGEGGGPEEDAVGSHSRGDETPIPPPPPPRCSYIAAGRLAGLSSGANGSPGWGEVGPVWPGPARPRPVRGGCGAERFVKGFRRGGRAPRQRRPRLRPAELPRGGCRRSRPRRPAELPRGAAGGSGAGGEREAGGGQGGR